jgi:phosphoserine phosphatase RsbU/P
LSYVNAGHNPPMLFHKNGNERQLSRLDSGGTVVGMIPQFSYRQTTVELNPGDLLVMYTDGVSEAMNPAEEEWGEERMTSAIERCEGLSAAGTVEQILQAADEFARGAKQHDDMTLVVLRVL